jgi:hypothetical protein
MPDDSRYQAALSAASDLLAKLDAQPQMTNQGRLALATFRILDAIGEAEQLAREEMCRFLCPACFQPQHIDASLRGRKVKCRHCGHVWRAPETQERN